MSVQYWVIQGVSAVAFNAHGGSYVLGIPQPTAIAGWIHACLRKMTSSTGSELSVNPRFAYAIDHYSGPSGISLNTRTEKGTAGDKKAIPAPIIDRPKAHAIFSIILEWTDAPGSGRASMFSPSAFKAAIETSRLLGASLFLREGDGAISCESSLEKALKKLSPVCFILSDATEQLEELMSLRALSGEDPAVANAMAELFGRPQDQSYKPRFVPVITGYQDLSGDGGGAKAPEEPRDINPSFWAEPILSAGLFQSKGSALRSARLGVFKGFWRSEKNETAWRLTGLPLGGSREGDELDEDFPV